MATARGISTSGMVEEGSTVVVGSSPALEDVLNGSSREHPFDKESFTKYASEHLFAESLQFLAEVDELRSVDDGETFARELQRIVGEYIREGAPSQVNISARVRRDTEAGSRWLIHSLHRDPSWEINRAVLDAAYKAVFSLVQNDQYARYVDLIVVQRQLMVSVDEALWWNQEELTARQFFSFPSPVNSAESRLHNFAVTSLAIASALLSYYYHFPWLWLCIVYGFLARCLCGPRLDPQAFFVLFVLRPLVADKLGWLKNDFVAGSPKHVAQMCGLCFSTTCLALAISERYTAMMVVVCLLVSASTMSGVCDFCIACHVYLMAVHAKWVPEALCEDCTVRYVKGKRASAKISSSSEMEDETSKHAHGIPPNEPVTPETTIDLDQSRV